MVMAIQIELRGPRGEILAIAEESWSSLDSTWPELAFADFPLLAGVDRDANTMFNRLQISVVLGELITLMAEASSGRAPLFERLLAMCHLGGSTVGAELWFLGD